MSHFRTGERTIYFSGPIRFQQSIYLEKYHLFLHLNTVSIVCHNSASILGITMKKLLRENSSYHTVLWQNFQFETKNIYMHLVHQNNLTFEVIFRM